DITTTDPDFICVGDSIDLSMYVTNPDGGELTYHTSMTDADTDTGALLSSVVTPDLGENIYWVRSELTYGDNVCYSIASITVSVQECITCETAFAYDGEDNSFCFSEYPEMIPNDSRWGWTNFYDSAADAAEAELKLYAGAAQCNIKDAAVGEVTVYDNENGTIDVTFTAYENYILSSVHLYVGCEPLQYKKQGKNYSYTVAPGQYNMNPNGDIGYVSSYTIENIEVSGGFYLIAHADVCTSEYSEIIEDLRAESVPGVYTLNKRFSAMQACIPEGKPNKTASTVEAQSAETNTDGFSAYPVPFTEVLNIEYDFEFTADATIEIYDFKGQFLRSYRADGVTKGDVTTIQVDFALRSNQVYIVNVIANGNRYSKTVISGNGK
ncbi:T9SS type A sorting domain-containing protein, partial [Salegentibacter sediminis]|uniref:T9SS type A sorting domain-containing protein n=1 Tax=Salegentibacter sediminis TaxID=1930251 RepID=UPI0012FFA43A